MAKTFTMCFSNNVFWKQVEKCGNASSSVARCRECTRGAVKEPFVFIMNLLTTQPFKGFLTLQYLLSEPKQRPHIFQNHCEAGVS